MTKYILCMGQSNAIGRTGPTVVDNEMSQIWNNQNDITTTANVGNAWVDTFNVNAAPFVGGKGSFLASVGAFLGRLGTPNELHRMILVATGGLSIDQWHNGTSAGAMYARMVAVLAAAGVTKVDALLWHQGEQDEATYTTYVSRFNALLARLQSDGYIDANTPVVVGETTWANPNINGALRSLTANPRIACAHIGGFTASDGVHFDDQFTWHIALTYARELSRLPGPWNRLWKDPDFVSNAPVLANPTTNNLFRAVQKDFVPQREFVYACGRALSIPTGVDTKIPLRSMMGNHGLIAADGSFSPLVDGIYRFDIQTFGSGGKTRAKLLDYQSKELAFVAYSGSSDAIANNPILSGFAFLRLWRGDVVWLGVNQASGSTQTLDTLTSANFNRMAVTYMGEDTVK